VLANTGLNLHHPTLYLWCSLWIGAYSDRWCSARWIQYTHVSLKVTNMSGDPTSRG